MAWRDAILSHFPEGAYPLTVAQDPDGLLLDEGIAAALDARGYTLMSYADLDPVAFRLVYETEFRPWTPGDEARPLVLRTPLAGPRAVPFDVTQRGRLLRFGLDETFPSLHYGTLQALPVEMLDAAEAAAPPGRKPLGETETVALLLRHVYDADPSTVRAPEDLLRVLLRLHYRGVQLPPSLARAFIDATKETFGAWHLDQIVPNRAAFFAFLQERWPLFVAAHLAHDPPPGRSGELPRDSFDVPGPPYLPLGHEDVRVYIDNLFMEGFLHPIEPPAVVVDAGWMAAGLIVDPDRDRARRVEHLVRTLATDLPDAEAPHGAWTEFAPRYGELLALVATGTSEADDDFAQLRDRIDERFTAWTLARYNSLRTLPPLVPAMLHHIPSSLARQIGEDAGRVALVLLDGLAFSQWAAMAPVVEEQLGDLRLATGGVFAWLPTVTPVSRQAVFSGQAPHYFASTIGRTDRDEAGWKQFWAGRGLASTASAYVNVKGDPADSAAVQVVIDDYRVRAFGLVVRKTDEIVHGATLGARSAVNEAVQWAQTGWLAETLRSLVRGGFSVAITSDHGNVEAIGIGRPQSGVRALDRGERVRVYDSTAARDADVMPGSVAWTPAGLPDGVETLFAPPRSAFVHDGDIIVGHGGISLEELVVPLVHVLSVTT